MILRGTMVRWRLSCFAWAISMLMLALVASQENACVGSSLLQADSLISKRTKVLSSGPEGKEVALGTQVDMAVESPKQEGYSDGASQSFTMTNVLSSWYGSAASAAANMPGITKGGRVLEVVRTRVKTTFSDISQRKHSYIVVCVVICVFVLLLLSCCLLYSGRESPDYKRASAPTAGTTMGTAMRSPSAVTRQHSSPFAPSLKARSPSFSSPARPDVQMQFCPELVVPEQCECILVVPVYAPSGTFNICDMTGRAVLHAMASGQGAAWKLEILSATGELTCCVQARPGSLLTPLGADLEFQLLDARATLYAKIVRLPHQERFVLTTQSGLKIEFWGNFRTQAVNVTDDEGAIIASTEPCGPDFDHTGIYYRLRVAPRANVGHALCALLCIGQFLQAR